MPYSRGLEGEEEEGGGRLLLKPRPQKTSSSEPRLPTSLGPVHELRS